MFSALQKAFTKVQTDPIKAVDKLFSALVLISACLIAPAVLGVFLLVPYAFDTLHLHDTMFLADIGWRVLNGLTPALDFGHFYGGVTATYVAWAFSLFGANMKSIDYAFVLALLSVVCCAGVLVIQRLPKVGTAALFLLIVACLLARVPLEQLTAVQRPVSAHSFFYNRFAIGLSMPLCVFALIPTTRRGLEWGGGLVAGFAVFIILLTKPTFAIFAPFFLLALVAMRRWPGLMATVVGLALAIPLLDPGLAKWQASFHYAISTAASNTSLSAMVLKCFAVFFVHPLALLLVLTTFMLSVVAGITNTVSRIVAAVLLAAGFTGMVATMGWPGDIGQQTLPFMAVIALVFAEVAARQREDQGKGATTAGPSGIHGAYRSDSDAAGIAALTRIISAVSVLAFSLPNLAQTALSGGFALLQAELIQTTATPIDSYLAWSDEFRDTKGRAIGVHTSWSDQVAAAVAHLEAQKSENVGVQYVRLVEGVRLLQQIPNIKTYGISGDMAGLAFALGAPPVAGFPPWVHLDVPELAAGEPIAKDVDLLLLQHHESSTTRRIQNNMGDDFVLCLSSDLWKLYRRWDADIVGCNAS